LIDDLATRIGLSPHAKNAVRLIAARRRLRALPEIARQLQRLVDEKAGILRATVKTAQPLSASYYDKLTAALEAATKMKIVITKEEDPSLLAGVVTTIGDRTIDGSLKGRLWALGRQLENQGP
jgi:F-type H+-transporting ATPase subunit delta